MQRWHPVPAAVYSLVEQTPGAVLLEAGPGAVGELSFLFLNPSQILTAHSAAEVEPVLAAIEAATAAGRFAAGYLAYEAGAWAEPSSLLAAQRNDESPGSQLAWFGIYSRPIVFDHARGAFPDALPDLPGEPGQATLAEVALALDESAYSAAVEAIHEAIRSGDAYQLNFTFPLTATVTGGPAALYARLRQSQPAPYGAFLNPGDGRHILSFSPELFFRIESAMDSRRIVAQPMKGTMRRGRTTAEDQAAAQWLQSDPKNRAENVMIVDLLRNDLGRVCQFGSVRVPQLFAVERHQTLWQMTSTVSGELLPDAGWRDILRALFPSGSVTGAPKVRAMQLLAGLERRPRGVYSGAIGYFGPEQARFNVAIRTLEVAQGKARMGIGSGITIDSLPAEEFRECLLKAKFLTRAQPEFELIETMLWHDGYPLLELHLGRLADSAHYFNFPCDPETIRRAALSLAAGFPTPQPLKVRLLLNRSGGLRFEVAAIQPTPPVRLCLAARRADPTDPFLFHKTTHRPIYAAGLAAAQAAGFDDALFLNLAGEVTETALGNIFVETAGRWATPPIESGLLAGVYRRHLLATRPGIEVRPLTLPEVKTADRVYVSNAVRGLRPVQIVV